MAWLGWRVVFVVFDAHRYFGCGHGSRLPKRRPCKRLHDTLGCPSIAMILSRRALWGSCLGAFCQTYALYLVLSWLPMYLIKERGLSLPAMAQIGAGVYALSALTSVLTVGSQTVGSRLREHQPYV